MCTVCYVDGKSSHDGLACIQIMLRDVEEGTAWNRQCYCEVHPNDLYGTPATKHASFFRHPMFRMIQGCRRL